MPLDLPERKSLPHWHLNGARSWNPQFVTTCVSGRRPLLAHNDVAALILDAWTRAGRWLVGRYVLMPDHLHLFCAPADDSRCSLKSWMQYWRADVTRRWPRAHEKPIWQRDFFEHRIRQSESYSEKWRYVFDNPVRGGLVPRAEYWPYQGELNILRGIGID